MKRRDFMISAAGTVAGMALLPRMSFAAEGVIDWYTSSDSNILDFWANTVKPKFEAANPGITINLVDAGDGAAQDYAYTRKLDERLAGREHELCIHVISPFHDYAESEQGLQRLSAYEQESLIVAMPPDARLMHELLMLKRTDKYIQQNISRAQNAGVSSP